MEWRGINLTDFRVRQWKSKIYKQFCCLVLIVSVAIGLAVHLQLAALQINQQNRPLAKQNQQLKTERDNLHRKLEQYRSSPIRDTVQTFTKSQVGAFLNLLQSLPLPQGGVEEAIFEYDDMPIMKIVGVLINSDQFERLEKYLSEQKTFKYSLVSFQLNEQQEIEFVFNIMLRE
ncbi:hypothetical protein ACQP31_01030 [Actinobacillus pleuropneumoniae]|uniref:PilN n=10 Tax=Actinobacillus pleuropneumoniae TaxID=715 RepID=A0A223MFE2_ACTPL|nr:hypothetical protein [Actinobacillus pleuropneumoniae]ABY68802.1 hypothetical protein APJL_0198 [Actinobacillus pleuropneumoniae serovar 3 str. JL03]ACE60852.1 hypothetical protein APP7_0200 [Actinobacillus pleuropneumoniae serovar 7 str. AP76]ASU16117.1 hypothetical protein CHY23_01364 [Actinobacillus pleuropneumoniae]AWG94613.1 hypothetical protein APPSER1_01020 [Actinobacillus pleuropneumoniae serovar 1 str. 4074]AXA20686.1 hypothetical protein DRF63_01020 [Actinobacillus pleuropneumonia